eukprot:SAG11_NODE_31743_length_289_cov_1.152632_1_plen_67_part_10
MAVAVWLLVVAVWLLLSLVAVVVGGGCVCYSGSVSPQPPVGLRMGRRASRGADGAAEPLGGGPERSA